MKYLVGKLVFSAIHDGGGVGGSTFIYQDYTVYAYIYYIHIYSIYMYIYRESVGAFRNQVLHNGPIVRQCPTIPVYTTTPPPHTATCSTYTVYSERIHKHSVKLSVERMPFTTLTTFRMISKMFMNTRTDVYEY